MDLYAYALGNLDYVQDYLKKHYGDIPRFRGVRFMKLEEKQNADNSEQIELFNKFCGQDVIYIHTRCGCYDKWDDPDMNYQSFKADEWEEKNKSSFLGHCSDEFDGTYCDHYFKAVVDDEYKEILKNIEEALKEEE